MDPRIQYAKTAVRRRGYWRGDAVLPTRFYCG
jgi:hypothetical protein